MPAVDHYVGGNNLLTAPVRAGEVVVPHDTNEQTIISRAIYVGGQGNVTVLMADGAVLTFVALPIGIHPIRAKRVNSTGTTATSMLFLE
jgi:hypothetical protein